MVSISAPLLIGNVKITIMLSLTQNNMLAVMPAVVTFALNFNIVYYIVYFADFGSGDFMLY